MCRARSAYWPLPALLPRPRPKEVILKEMSVYESMSHLEFMQLPFQERSMLAEARLASDKPQINHGWGEYNQQVLLLKGLMERKEVRARVALPRQPPRTRPRQ